MKRPKGTQTLAIGLSLSSRASLSSTFSSSEMMMVAFFLALLNDQYDNCGKEGGVITGWDVFFYVVVFVLIGKR